MGDETWARYQRGAGPLLPPVPARPLHAPFLEPDWPDPLYDEDDDD